MAERRSRTVLISEAQDVENRRRFYPYLWAGPALVRRGPSPPAVHADPSGRPS